MNLWPSGKECRELQASYVKMDKQEPDIRILDFDLRRVPFVYHKASLTDDGAQGLYEIEFTVLGDENAEDPHHDVAVYLCQQLQETSTESVEQAVDSLILSSCATSATRWATEISTDCHSSRQTVVVLSPNIRAQVCFGLPKPQRWKTGHCRSLCLLVHSGRRRFFILFRPDFWLPNRCRRHHWSMQSRPTTIAPAYRGDGYDRQSVWSRTLDNADEGYSTDSLIIV